MYRLEVHYPGRKIPAHSRWVANAVEVLTIIPELLSEHHGCEQVSVWFESTRLFTVDCRGSRIDG